MINLVSASILSADMLNLESEIKRLEDAGVDMLHFDVMDGVFVNNITFGLPVLEQIRRKTDIILDVHLMISDPLKYVRDFADAGADIITFHIESESDALKTAETIRSTGRRTAIALKPDTSAESVFPLMPYLDMVLAMTVEPGFSGQKFMDMSGKIRKIRGYAESNGLAELDIQVDGGINGTTAETVRKAGANILVSGSYLFRAENMKKAVETLRA